VAGTRPPGTGHVLLGAAGLPSLAAPGDQLRAVYRLSDPALSELPLQRLLDELLDRIREILDVDTTAILLLDPETNELVARAARGIEEEVERGVRIPVGRGFAGRIAAERSAITIPDVDHADVLNPILREVGIRSLLGVPLVMEGRVVGVLHVGSRVPRIFSTADAAILQLAGNRAAPAIEHARLFDALDREHRSAVALQRSLLPDLLPDIAETDVAARYLPARDEVGGDWYDVLELSGGRVGIAIGDVAGHGVRAAATMGQLRTALRAYALEDHPPGEALRLLDALLQTIRGRAMATVAYGVLNPETGDMTIACAGHPPGVIVTASGEARLLETHRGPPLGALPFAQFRETPARLEPGDALALYTDGLIETRDAPLTERLEMLRAAAADAPDTAPDPLCDHLLDALVPSRASEDDVAVVVVRRLAIPNALRLRLPAEPDVLGRVRLSLGRWLRARGAGTEDVHAIMIAVGEACANAIEHAYPPGPASFDLEATLDDTTISVHVRDHGGWREPRGQHRGRGLALMEATMDEVDVRRGDNGSEIAMRRRLRG
jgi:serine phosphatase RsbU (regulator of sigma subunit)/anti-sigma regulatory factor (Ser/Thr protein kinase)